MRRVRWFVREWMIGWHQGAKERHERAAQRHRVAEDRWRYRNTDPACTVCGEDPAAAHEPEFYPVEVPRLCEPRGTRYAPGGPS